LAGEILLSTGGGNNELSVNVGDMALILLGVKSMLQLVILGLNGVLLGVAVREIKI
jgi:hypothetical protein